MEGKPLTEREQALAGMGGTLTAQEKAAAARNAYQTGNIFAPKAFREEGKKHPEYSQDITRSRAKLKRPPVKIG